MFRNQVNLAESRLYFVTREILLAVWKKNWKKLKIIFSFFCKRAKLWTHEIIKSYDKPTFSPPRLDFQSFETGLDHIKTEWRNLSMPNWNILTG